MKNTLQRYYFIFILQVYGGLNSVIITLIKFRAIPFKFSLQ